MRIAPRAAAADGIVRRMGGTERPTVLKQLQRRWSRTHGVVQHHVRKARMDLDGGYVGNALIGSDRLNIDRSLEFRSRQKCNQRSAIQQRKDKDRPPETETRAR